MWKTTGPGLGGLWVGKAIEVSSGWEAVGALGRVTVWEEGIGESSFWSLVEAGSPGNPALFNPGGR